MVLDLTDAEINTLKDFACELADVAATVTLPYFKKPIGVTDKDKGDGFDPVTHADQEAERAIRQVIEARYPDHRICGEEFERKVTDSPFEWYLDPIDGTRAFISGLPTWGTLISLAYKGEPIIGIIDQPYIKERYLGWPGGASLNGSPIKSRPCATLDTATLSTTDPDLFDDAERPLFDQILSETQLVRYGLDCYAYAVVAAGHMDIVIENSLKPWDMMALIPVVKGSGGDATDWNGEPAGESGRLLAVGDKALLPLAKKILSTA
ncbi:MAG: histidinol-phosphatase [Kordiimonas sp.]